MDAPLTELPRLRKGYNGRLSKSPALFRQGTVWVSMGLVRLSVRSIKALLLRSSVYFFTVVVSCPMLLV